MSVYSKIWPKFLGDNTSIPGSRFHVSKLEDNNLSVPVQNQIWHKSGLNSRRFFNFAELLLEELINDRFRDRSS